MTNQIVEADPVVIVSESLLRSAFDRSVLDLQSSGVLADADASLVESGRIMATHIDRIIATGTGQEITKALYLMPHLVNVMREMLATPASRAGFAKVATEAKSKVSQMRERHLKSAG